jgi:hypothetical protein
MLMKSRLWISGGLLLCACAAMATISTTNLGDGTTRLRADYVIPTASVVDVRDDICRGLGWTPTSTFLCTQPRVNAGSCAIGQLGTQVTETCIQSIDRNLREYLHGLRRAGELKEIEDAQVAPVRAADKSGDLQ